MGWKQDFVCRYPLSCWRKWQWRMMEKSYSCIDKFLQFFFTVEFWYSLRSKRGKRKLLFLLLEACLKRRHCLAAMPMLTFCCYLLMICVEHMCLLSAYGEMKQMCGRWLEFHHLQFTIASPSSDFGPSFWKRKLYPIVAVRVRKHAWVWAECVSFRWAIVPRV